MKTNKLLILSGVITALILSCENPLGLGEKLDVQGPVVEFTSPVPRKAVPDEFSLEGKISDRTGIDRVIIKTQINNREFPKQWRYSRGVWEISENYGSSWTELSGAQWNGTEKSAVWKVSVNMAIDGADVQAGEYLFSVQAWDTAGFSDDNSFKTLVVIYDAEKPSVEITRPYIYSRYIEWGASQFVNAGGADNADVTELNSLHSMADNSGLWKDTAMIGKFMTQGFNLQWQIEDDHDIWSVELRFYKYDTAIDEYPLTPLPDTYYYRYWQNVGLPPDRPTPDLYPKPNGSIYVPALDVSSNIGGGRTGSGEYEFKTAVSEKTTIKVVSLCYDASGKINEEKELGWFIYWPKADQPWINFAEGMNAPSPAHNQTAANRKSALDASEFMIYPGRNIKSNAFHAHGVKEVVFSLYEYTIAANGDVISGTPINLEYMESMPNVPAFQYVDASKTAVRISNPPRGTGVYSTIFSWEFRPPARSAYYVIRAQAYSLYDKPSGEYTALFRVQDISFPIFGEPSPSASDPLFMHINTSDNSITVSGRLTDATDITYLTMAWINPQSREYSAMSQLEYFRDQDYSGWKQAKTITKGQTSMETADAGLYGNNYPYDSAYPNRLWNLDFSPAGRDEDERNIFTFSKKVYLNELNIGMNAQPLRSQMFLIRAENPDGRCTIITYAPQGDTLVPTIEIVNVQVFQRRNNADTTVTVLPRTYAQIPQFQDGDRIVISGNWTEDSTAKLNVGTYLYPKMEFAINGNLIPGNANTTDSAAFTQKVINPSNAASTAASGTFTVTATVGSGTHLIQTSAMKDTLVVGAAVRDIGGNPSEASASWLIQSDRLRFLRVSSENADKTYNHVAPNNQIKVFLEFSKPVRLKDQNIRPSLILNTANGNAARAVYDEGQNVENTRQFFTYTVTQGENTPGLDVTGLWYNGAAIDPSNTGAAANYPFVWEHRGEGNTVEEMRITRYSGHALGGNGSYLIEGFAQLPTSAGNTRSLMSNKSIIVDTVAPAVHGVTNPSATPQGWHRYDSSNPAEIHISVTFNKNVRLGTAVPYLVLNANSNGTTNRTETSPAPRVSGSVVTFVYKVKQGDNTEGSLLQIQDFGGEILDTSGTPLAVNAFTSMAPARRNLAGVYIDTNVPLSPTVNIRETSSTSNPSNIIISTVNGTAVSGSSGGASLAPWTAGVSPGAGNIFNLGNVYMDELYLDIAPNESAASTDLWKLEYSTNYGKDWKVYSDAGGTPAVIRWDSSSPNGTYNITARQIDRAGNVSQWSKPVTFNWDRGALVSSIDSSRPNITHTKNSKRSDKIDITVHFRKPLSITGTSSITLNSTNTPVTLAAPGGSVSQLTFTYNVGDNDNTPNNGTAALAVTAMNIQARDDAQVDVTGRITVPASPNRLQDIKTITVKTGPLLVSGTPYFSTGTIISDGSLGTTLVIDFNGSLQRGSGFITITQSASGYRLPAVLTETQRNRYRNVVGAAAFDSFYTRGTNGFNHSASAPYGSPDTAPKFVLNYNIDPTSVTPNSGGTVGTIAKFADDFRKAESVKFNANASAVQIGGTNNTRLTINLTGTNALQVPGAEYTVEVDEGFVQDILENSSPKININPSGSPSGTNFTIGAVTGVAKPFIRIRKDQETVSVNTSGTATVPRITATQPLTTQARMDSRTPGAVIRYAVETSVTDVSDDRNNWWTPTANGGNNAQTLGPNDNGNVPQRPANLPANASSGGTQYNSNSPVTIGDGNYQGYIWRVYARAFTGAGTNANQQSEISEEVAYRTVLTYVINNMAAPAAGSGEQRLQNGSQIWLRGGDAIGSSSIPGFPLTWADDWDALKADGKRAGIRVMTMTANDNTNFNTSSTWKWVSWEVNVETYFDIIQGNDDANANANVARQYGPRQWAYQRAGWTSFKENYRMFPGKHRWLNTSRPNNLIDYNSSFNGQSGKGAVNFSGTWSIRTDYQNNSTDVTYVPPPQ